MFFFVMVGKQRAMDSQRQSEVNKWLKTCGNRITEINHELNEVERKIETEKANWLQQQIDNSLERELPSTSRQIRITHATDLSPIQSEGKPIYEKTYFLF